MKWSVRDDKGLKLQGFGLKGIIRTGGGKAENSQWFTILLQRASFIAVVARASFNYSRKDAGQKSFVQEEG